MVALVRPATDEAVLQDLNRVPLQSLRPEFVSQLDLLRKRILERIRPRRMGGIEATGAVLARWAQMFVDSFNDGKVPVLKDAVSLAKELRQRDLVDKALEGWNRCLVAPRLLVLTDKVEAKVFSTKRPGIVSVSPLTDQGLESWDGCIEPILQRGRDTIKNHVESTGLEADTIATALKDAFSRIQPDLEALELDHAKAAREMFLLERETPTIEMLNQLLKGEQLVAKNQREPFRQHANRIVSTWVPRWIEDERSKQAKLESTVSSLREQLASLEAAQVDAVPVGSDREDELLCPDRGGQDRA